MNPPQVTKSIPDQILVKERDPSHHQKETIQDQFLETRKEDQDLVLKKKMLRSLIKGIKMAKRSHAVREILHVMDQVQGHPNVREDRSQGMKNQDHGQDRPIDPDLGVNEIVPGQDHVVDGPDLPHGMLNHPSAHDQERNDHTRTQRNVSIDLVLGLNGLDQGITVTGHDLDPDPKVKDTRKIKSHGGDRILETMEFLSHICNSSLK